MRKSKKNYTISNVITTHILNNFKEYISVLLTFIVGIVIGVIIINGSNEEQIGQITTYINNFISDLKESGSIDTGALLAETFLSNLYLVLAMWFVGSTVIGIPIVYGVIAYKGFCLSYTISSTLITLGTMKGTCFSLASMLLQNLIYIPCLLALGVTGIRLYKSIMKDKRKENIKIEIVRHTVFSAFIGIVMICGTFIETYISTNLIRVFMNSI